MNFELAQIIALITHGNEYLSSSRRYPHELFPLHSTFQYISDVSFQKKKTLKAWVFGGLGSWNDLYIIDPSLEKEYQRISKSLYGAVIQSVGAVTNSTSDDRLRELSTC